MNIFDELHILEKLKSETNTTIFMSTFDKDDTLSALMHETILSFDSCAQILETNFEDPELHLTRILLEISRIEALLRAFVDQVEYYLQIVEGKPDKSKLFDSVTKFINHSFIILEKIVVVI